MKVGRYTVKEGENGWAIFEGEELVTDGIDSSVEAARIARRYEDVHLDEEGTA
jgi:hypothetical protein